MTPPATMGKIRIIFSPDGLLPDNVVTREGVEARRGWYAVTPNGVAHYRHCWYCARGLVKSWLRNFSRDANFWYNLERG